MRPEWPPGSPRDDDGGPALEPADAEEVVTKHLITNEAKSITHRQCGAADTVAGLHRRRRASWRTLRFDCGCVDLWVCRCEPSLSDRQVAGAVAAAHHLRELDLPPIFNMATRRALFKAGHRQLVAELHRRAGGEAA